MRLIFVLPLMIALFSGLSGGWIARDPGGHGGGGYSVTVSGIPGGSGGGGMAVANSASRAGR